VRHKCLDYILACKDYFKDFIDLDTDPSLEIYCHRKKLNKVWGDDLEIEAMSEIYRRPIEIYAYSSEPMRKYNEHCGAEGEQPLRLSYHGRNHYNCVLPSS
jgi:OTU domain-containing protein 5